MCFSVPPIGGPESGPEECRPCVLVVDDSESLLGLLEAFLTVELGWRVVSCGAGSGTVQAALEHRPSLILLDRILPDMGGEEVCRRLLERPETAGIPVVLMSGMTPAKGWEFERNVVTFLSKPFQLGALMNVLRTLLDAAQEAA